MIIMNTGFSVEKLSVETSDGRNVSVIVPFTYTCEDGSVISIPEHDTSDGASTPRFIWTIIPPFGVYWMAAVLHDFLYRFTDLPKDRCDNILYEAMIRLGTDKLEAWNIYEGVHLGGQSSFDEDRAKQKVA